MSEVCIDGYGMREHYKGYRYPKSIIGFAVRYYHRYKLSLRDVSELLLDRGIEVTYETIRNWNKAWGTPPLRDQYNLFKGYELPQ